MPISWMLSFIRDGRRYFRKGWIVKNTYPPSAYIYWNGASLIMHYNDEKEWRYSITDDDIDGDDWKEWRGKNVK